MEVYLSKVYTPIVFGDAAPSVPSFIGSKVIFVEILSALQATFLDRFLFSSNFVQLCIIVKSTCTHLVFGDAVPSVLSFIGSKVIFWFTFLCAL